MDAELIKRWNEVVKPGDLVYYLGDFCWYPKRAKEVINRLNGTKHLIRGNHDSKEVRKMKEWGWVGDLKAVTIDNKYVVMCHYPLRSWNGSFHGSYHLFGHCHNRLQEEDYLLSFDVGVDGWNFYPVSWEQVKEKMEVKIPAWKESRRKKH